MGVMVEDKRGEDGRASVRGGGVMAPGVGIPEPSGDPPGEDSCGGDDGSKARIAAFCRPGAASAAGVEVSTSFSND